MVMNIFDTDYTSLKNYNTNNAVSETASHNFNRDLCSFDFMFNSNTFSPCDPFKQKSDIHRPVNSFSNLKNCSSSDFIGTSLIQSDTKNTGNCSASDNNYSFLHDFAFDTNHQHNTPNNDQSWSPLDGQWSNGSDAPVVPIGTSPLSNGFINTQNNVLSSSPCVGGQSRLMPFINNQTPPPLYPVAQSPDSQAANIESMKIKEFLHHPLTNGSIQSPNIEDKDDIFGGSSSAFAKEESESLFTNFLHNSFNSISLNDAVGANNPIENDINVIWDSLDNFSVDVSAPATCDNNNCTSKNAWSKPLKFAKSTEIKDNKIDVIEPISRPKPSSKPTQQSTVKASVGRKVSELDDFDTFSVATKKSTKNGDFQVVCNKKSKAPKPVKSGPPDGQEKCSYGVKCLFGVECSRWHSPEEHEAFHRQKLPNGTRKCPWGAKCFRKLKCINFHSEKELEQFKKELIQ